MAVYYKIATQQTGLNLREKPSTSAVSLCTIPKDEIVMQNYILEPQSGWVAVDYKGYSGYVSADYIQQTEEKPNWSGGNSNTNNNAVVAEQDKQNGKTILIVGCLAAVAGAILAIFSKK